MKDLLPLPLTDDPMLVIAPHMDDESLGCGLLLASHPRKENLHVLFVTDGSHSPESAAGAAPAARRELARVREGEACAALAVLGVPAANVEFLGYEDGTLATLGERLEQALVEYLRCIGADNVLVPFRYDRHPDHLAISRAVTEARRSGAIGIAVYEYFVYSRWRLLPGGDIRRCLPRADLRRLEPGSGSGAALKRQAIDCHRSQTTCYFNWQTRPVLTRELLDRVCAEPELYLVHDPARPGRRALARGRRWVPIAHGLEPRLKRWKDRLAGWQGR